MKPAEIFFTVVFHVFTGVLQFNYGHYLHLFSLKLLS